MLNLFQHLTSYVGWIDPDTIEDDSLKQGQSKQAVRTFCTKNKFSAKEVKQVQDDT